MSTFSSVYSVVNFTCSLKIFLYILISSFSNITVLNEYLNTEVPRITDASHHEQIGPRFEQILARPAQT